MTERRSPFAGDYPREPLTMQEKTSYTPVRTQRPRRISVFDGQNLKKALLAGAAWLEVNREAINDLNVFPVPDGDTGSNMSATMQAAIREIVDSDDTSAATIAARVAHAALLGARGNSGVILSQILRGLAASRVHTMSTEMGVKKGRVTIDEEFGYEVVFLLRGEKLDVEKIRQAITDMGGVSTVVAGDEKLLKVHTHTERPGAILDYGVSLGSLLDINIENLQEQSLTYAAESEAEHAADQDKPATQQIATVAVVAGPGFENVFRSIGLTAIVPGGQTMNPSTEELLKAVDAVGPEQVILLPNNSNVMLSARQVAGLTSKTIYIVPTETMPQGIAALLGFNFEADFESNCKAMTEAAKNIQTAEITTAVRTAQIDGVRVREGDYVGLVNGNLAIAGQDMEHVIRETLQRMHIERYEIVTLYFGEDVTRQQAEEIAKRLKEKYSHLEIEVVDGGQPLYAYILSAE